MPRVTMLGMARPDTTGEAFFQPVNVALSWTNAQGQDVLTLKDPTVDAGVKGSFAVPQDYVSGGTVVFTHFEGGTSTGAKAFGLSFVSVPDGQVADVAWANTVTWTKAGENVLKEIDVTSQVMTGLSTSAGAQIQFYFYRDFSSDAYVGDLHGMSLEFDYEAA